MYFADFGCITSIGAGTEMTMAAISAEVCGYRESNFFCRNNLPAIMGLVDDGLFLHVAMDTDYTEPLSEKMIRGAMLMYFALQDLQQRFPLQQPCPLIWLDGEPGNQEPLPPAFVRCVLSELEAPVIADKIFFLGMGRASGIYALERANELLHKLGYDYVLIGAADTPYANAWLEELDDRARLKNAEAMDAFAPGEGSGFLLLARTPELAQAHSAKANPPVSVRFSFPGVARSPSHWGNTEPHKGEALWEAIVNAMQATGQEVSQLRCDAIVSSLNGELFWMKEHRVALARLAAQLRDAELHHPFEFTGDLGALSGIFLLAYSAHLILGGAHKQALVYASSDGLWRSAALATGVSGERPGS